MNKLLKIKNLVICGVSSLMILFLFYSWNDSDNSIAVYVPVSHDLYKYKDIDISVNRVDQLHRVNNAESRRTEDIHNKSPTSEISMEVTKTSDSGNEDLLKDEDHDHQPFDLSMVGQVNYDIWHWIVGYLVDDMRIIREFPSYPDEKKTASQLHNVFDEVDQADVKGRYGHKMYGYLLPPEPGSYSFKVDLTSLSAAASVELWISSDADPLSMNQVLSLVYDDSSRPVKRTTTTKSKVSIEVNMMSDVHYFEFLEKAYEGKIVADVKWKTPSSDAYVSIPEKSLALAVKLDENHNAMESRATHFLNGPLPSNILQTHHSVYSVSSTIYTLTDLNVLPTCAFTALYAKKRKIKPYHGVYDVHESKVFPKDETWFYHWKRKDRGNHEIDKSVVDKVVSLYTKALNASKEVKGHVMELRYLEETTNKNDGSRFLLEMDVQLSHPREEIAHTSEYVYLEKGTSNLCHTSNFQWTKSVDVHFIVSVKNLGLWVKHLIYNMEDIYDVTRDERFSLIIVDYESADMDIEQEVKKSSFKRIEVINLKGKFSRSGGLQTGIDYVTNKNSIVMTIDMHLTLPIGIVEYLRRHTVQYKMAFTPMFFRLNKGHTEMNYNGFWETLTYGIFAMYKSDWVTFGGFNLKKFKTKWGGEDWDILDRALAKGFEAFRIRPPGLVHYHHTRKGMWGNSEIKFTKKWTLH